MTYANPFQRVAIWGLVGLLVLTALPIHIVFAQTGAPVFTSGTSASISGSVVRVYWGYENNSAPSGDGTVQVYYNKDDATVPFSTSAAHAATTSSNGQADIPLSSFTAGQTYYFKVVAWDPDRGQGASAIKSLFVSAQVAAPNATGSTTTLTSSAVTFSPTFSSAPEKVRVKIFYNSDRNQQRSDDSFTTTPYTVNSSANWPLNPGVKYYYTIWATSSDGSLNGVGVSSDFTMPGGTLAAPSQPTNFTVVADAANPETALKLAWAAPASGTVAEYLVKQRTAGSFVSEADWTSAGATTYSTGTSLTYTATGLTKDTMYYFAVKACSALGTSSSCSPLVAGSGKPQSAATNTLPSGAITLKGYVREGLGTTTPGGALAQAPLRLSSGSAYVTRMTDASGYYHFDNLGGGTYTLHADPPGNRANLQSQDLTGTFTAGPVNWDFALPPTSTTTTATCTLTTDKTTYVSNATEFVNYTYTCQSGVTSTVIRVAKPDGTVTQYNSGTTNSTTSYTRQMGIGTSNLVAGNYTLQLCMNDSACSPSSMVTVPFTITSTPSTGTAGVQGTVKNANGQPVAGATVGFSSGSTSTNATTDSAGHFALANLAAGTYTFGIGANNYQPITNQPVTLTSGQTLTLPDVTLQSSTTTLPTGMARLRVTVTDYTGAPLAGATVGMTSSSGISSSSPTSSTGVIEFTNLSAGVYMFGVAPTGRTDLLASANNTVTLTENATVSRDIVLQKMSVMTIGSLPAGDSGVVIMVTDSTGKIVTNARVTMRQMDAAGTMKLMGYVPADPANPGTFRLSNIQAGDYLLGIDVESHPEFTPITAESVHLSAGAVTNKGVTMQLNVTIPPPQPIVPVIHRLEPTFGRIGTVVRIYGANFHPTDTRIRMGSGGFPRMASDGTTLTFTVPQYLDPCPPEPGQSITCMAVAQPVEPGRSYPVVVTTPSGASASFQFAVTSEIVPPIDQCLPSENQAEWYCVKNDQGYEVTVRGRCYLDKMRVFQPRLQILATGQACATDQPTPVPVGSGTVKGTVLIRDLATGAEKGFRTKVYLRPQTTYTFGSAAPTFIGTLYTVETADNGVFTIPNVIPGSYFIGADALGAEYERLDDGSLLGIAASATVTKYLYFKKLNTSPIVAKGGTVTGRVTDYNDRPLTGVDVWLQPTVTTTAVVMRPQRTDDQGVYTFAGMTPGKYRMGVGVPPQRNDLIAPPATELGVAASAIFTQDFRLEKRQEQGIGLPFGDAYVKGTVTAASGSPVAGAIVQLKGYDKSGFGYMHTDPYGVYVFQNIAPGRYRFGVYPPPLAPQFTPFEADVAIGSGVTVQDATLQSRDGVVPPPEERGAATVRGRVLFREAAGEYPMKTQVFLSYTRQGAYTSQSQMTTEDGAFVFAGLPAGGYELGAALPPHALETTVEREQSFYKLALVAGEDKVQDIIFKRGRGGPVQPIPVDDIEQFYQDVRRVLTERQTMLGNMINDLKKRGGAAHELTALQEQLILMLNKAEQARKAKDDETLKSLTIELQTIHQTLDDTIARLFRGAGNTAFIEQVRSLLVDAPKFMKEMGNEVAKREKRGENVASFTARLDDVESIRSKAQSLFDAGKIERVNNETGAGDLAFAMLDRGQSLYCDLGLGGGSCAVKFTGPVKTPAYITTTLGKAADKNYTQLVKTAVTSSTNQLALDAALPTLAPETMRAMFDAFKEAPNALKPIVQNLEYYTVDARTKMLETNVNVHSEVQGLKEANDALSEVRGISKAAGQTVDGLRKQLEKFVFPPGVGELAHTLLEAFNTTIASEQITNVKTLEGYVRTFHTTMNIYMKEAVQEKFDEGFIPAKNIQETSPLFASALTLREAGVLDIVINTKGEVPLNARMNGKTFVRFLETAVDDTSAVAGATERKLLRAKTVNGQDVFLVLIDAYDLDVANSIRNNRSRLASYMARELGVKVSAAELARPVTTSQVIQYVGAAEQKYGSEVLLEEVPEEESSPVTTQ